MKKLLVIVVLFMMYAPSSFGQVTVDGVNINDLDIKFCRIVAFNKSAIKAKYVVTIDYGQINKFNNTQIIKGNSQKEEGFSSIIDALNFMVKNGWEYVDSYAISDSRGHGTFYHYLLKKK